MINPNNADVHYIKREKPIAFLTINEYIELIENFKNKFQDNSITKAFKEHKMIFLGMNLSNSARAQFAANSKAALNI